MDRLKELAKGLTEKGNYRYIPKDLIEQAKENGMVIVYGASDDLMV